MPGAPQLREVAWLVTGPDRDPVRHLYVRLEERMDGSGVWTLGVRECSGLGRKTMRCYGNEADARDRLQAVYALYSRQQLPMWDPEQREEARWRVRTFPPSEYDLRIRGARS